MNGLVCYVLIRYGFTTEEVRPVINGGRLHRDALIRNELSVLPGMTLISYNINTSAPMLFCANVFFGMGYAVRLGNSIAYPMILLAFYDIVARKKEMSICYSSL